MLESQSDEARARRFIGDDGLPLAFERDNPFSFTQDAIVRTDPASGTLLPSQDVLLETSHRAPSSAERRPLLDESLDATLRPLAVEPENPLFLVNAAMMHLNAERFEEAEAFFLRALKMDPTMAVATTGLAKLYGLQGRLDDASALYAALLISRPTDTHAMLNQAQLYIQMRRLSDAEVLFQTVAKLDPGSIAAHAGLGILQLLNGNIRAAVVEFRRALAADGRHAGIYSNLGVCYSLLRSDRKAERAFATALTLDPQNPTAIKAFAECSLRRVMPERAIELLAPYVKRDDEDLRAKVLLARAYYMAGRIPETTQQLLPALRKAKEQGDIIELSGILNNLGVVASAQGHTERALEFYQKSLELHERQHVALHNRALLLMEEARHTEAYKALEQWLLFYPDDAVALSMMVAWHNRSEEYTAAGEFLDQALNANPDEVAVFGPLTVLFGEVHGDFRKCVSYLERVRTKHPADWLVLNNLAYSYLMLDEVSKAREILDSVPPKASSAPDANEKCLIATRGLLLLKEGSETEARRLYNLAASRARTSVQRLDVLRKRDLEFARAAAKEGEGAKAIRILRSWRERGGTQAPFLFRQARSLLDRLINDPSGTFEITG